MSYRTRIQELTGGDEKLKDKSNLPILRPEFTKRFYVRSFINFLPITCSSFTRKGFTMFLMTPFCLLLFFAIACFIKTPQPVGSPDKMESSLPAVLVGPKQG